MAVVDPPWYLFGTILLLVGLMIGRTAWPVKGSRPDHGQFEWWAIVVAAPLVLAAIGLLTGQTTLTLSRQSGQLNLEARYAGVIRWRSAQVPLSDVREALVEFNEAGRGLTILLTSGRTLSLGFHSPRGGYPQAAAEINRFLNPTPPRTDRR